MSVYIEGAAGQQVLDGHFIDLYAGHPRAALAAPLQSLQFNAAAPSLTVNVNPALDYTVVVRGPAVLRLIMTPD